MQTLRQFVSGTDFSECADQALELAVQLAVGALARLTVVHVCELDADGGDDPRVRASSEALTEVIAKHRRSGVEITGVLRCGKPWKKLDNVAAEVGASLIVVGRHGAGRGRSVEIGSVADQLVRSANRSVLTVACDFDRLASEANATQRQ